MYLVCRLARRDLDSFPTRRSSDLGLPPKGQIPCLDFPAGSLDRSRVRQIPRRRSLCRRARLAQKSRYGVLELPQATLKSMRAETAVSWLVTSLQYSCNNHKCAQCPAAEKVKMPLGPP